MDNRTLYLDPVYEDPERPEFMTDKHLEWMFDLRDDINSSPHEETIWNDAALWLQDEFGDVTKKQAKAIVAWWTKKYGKTQSKEGPSYDIERGIPGRVE